jgi:hypothetical protein
MLRYEDAMKLVLKEDKHKIIDEMMNESTDRLSKSYPLLADAFRSKDEKTRKDAERLLDVLIANMECLD